MDVEQLVDNYLNRVAYVHTRDRNAAEEAEALINEELGLFLGVCLTLPYKYREAILLHYYEDITIN